MIKIVLIDDEPLARSIIKEYLEHYPEFTVVRECNNGFEGLKAITEHQPELVFLDIQMPKINGFEMLELIELPPAVIFTTAFEEYAIKAFDTFAVDYLLKPFSKERFDKAIQKWLEQNKTKNNHPKDTQALLDSRIKNKEEQTRVVVKSKNNIRILPVQEILYIEAYDDYVKIHVQDDCFLKKKTMQFYEDVLDGQQFVRVHRSFILQVQQITRIEAMEKDTHVALLKGGVKIPLSRTGYAKLKLVLGL